MEQLGMGRSICLAILLLTTAIASLQAEENSGTAKKPLDTASLKKQMLELNRDLFILEEELLFPSETQVAVFLSVDVGHYFQLDALKLSLNGETVAHHLYTAKQLDALRRGGLQRVFLGNVKQGEHELVAVFTGRGPKGRDFRRAQELHFDKTTDAAKLELKVVDDGGKQQPRFLIEQW